MLVAPSYWLWGEKYLHMHELKKYTRTQIKKKQKKAKQGLCT